ncbi:two-component system histidine kinase PnpS [Ureibacillus chungkukjangi]|uniref:histidine kinase n=1 Tax=Ureibacillus chungkukjangi TaxID=1202712 RepID=A0A318TVX4_9BACL|nr:HAMP domain-containing sensor histidine kinase [Ureibacillus chungkukjangi]MCM3387486.1 ATP-binding protein [Ureibacillus chungkukjangi]PYF09031.1 two-component system phosphate regulon sensor histidine kinase PhoR [Ureibacillus chungkukjangi]
MKAYRNRLFVTFMILTGSILAVLGFILGQLFPFIIENFGTKNSLVFDMESIEETRRQFASIIAFLIFLSFVLICFVANYLIRNLLDPIENITLTARELTKGNYRARAYALGPVSIVELRNSINILARNLQEIEKIREIEEERLKTLIENMGSALIMIDREATVSIVNRQFLEGFELSIDEVKGFNFLTLGLPSEIEKFIDHVFLTELPYRKQIEVEIHQEIQYKQIYGAPVVGDHGRWLGVVIVMHDISELIRLEQIRKDFVANVSHELRTPITSIKGFSETLLDGAFKDEKMLISFLDIIYQESNRLQMLIQDLLELSKIEQHGFSVNIMPASLQEVLIRSVELTSPRMDEKNMQFDVDIVRDVMVMGDFNRLIQIFTNLITNSITYSPENTTITLRIKANSEYGIIEVEDQGMGIEKNEIARIFERFYRIDKARSRNSGGTGLGLAIVKHLVEAHHGKINVESTVGKGTCMKVLIPLKK